MPHQCKIYGREGAQTTMATIIAVSRRVAMPHAVGMKTIDELDVREGRI